MALSMSCSFTARPEGLHELGLVALVVGDPGYGIPDACCAHLERIRDWQRRLLFQCIDPAVPKLTFVIEGVQNGWGVALADTAMDAHGRGPAVSEGPRRIVAGDAGDGPVP
jgi:hypothetical protein